MMVMNKTNYYDNYKYPVSSQNVNPKIEINLDVVDEIDFDRVNKITKFQYKTKSSFEFFIHNINQSIVKFAYKGHFGFTYVTDIPEDVNKNAVLDYYLNKGFIITMVPLRGPTYEITIGWNKDEEDEKLSDNVYRDWCNGEDRRISWDEQMRVARGDYDKA